MATINKRFRVDKFSHNFVITQYDQMGERIIKSFASGFIQYGMVRQGLRYTKIPIKMYAARCLVEQEYRFQINSFDKFVLHCIVNGIPRSEIEIHEHVAERGLDVDLRLETSKQPRNDQPEVLAYLAKPEPTISKMVGIQPGGGKTFCSMYSICQDGRRMVAVLKNKYIDKWKSDIQELANCTAEDIVVVKGSAALMAVIASATDGTLKAKAIIISGRTLANWFSLYEEIGDKVIDRGYDCTPPDLFKALKADVRLIDEVHEEFHFNFKLDLYTHVHRSISLSATLLSDDQMIQSMIDLAYPFDWRYNQKEIVKFIRSKGYLFRIKNGGSIKVIGAQGYSHHLLEQYIISKKQLLADYLEMIAEIIDKRFVKNFIPGTRALLFCASIDMCTLLTNYLQLRYKGVDVRRYVEDDPYENVIEARICVSTVQSAGTGVDILGLKIVVLTTAMSSSKSNIQGAGRLRYIEGMDLEFYYLVCEDIAKHMEYHVQKIEIMKDRALHHEDIQTNLVLG